MSSRSRGFTIVELLVATAVLGILIAAVIALTSSFLGFSRRVSAINERLTDLNDVMGYVALNARRSVRVVGQGNDVSITPLGGTAFDCSLAEADPCFALVVPVTNPGTGAISGYDLLAYRVAPLSDWIGNPGVAGGWDGAATPAMFEYGVNLCTGCTSAPGIAGSSVTDVREALVVTDLFFEDDAGIAFEPFAISGELVAGSGDFSRITVRMRTRASGTIDDVRVPTDGPLQLQVVRRP